MTPSNEVQMCRNCGRPVGAGGADELDARCYQFRRRTGRLPSPAVQEARAHKWSVKLDDEANALVAKAALEQQLTVAEWIRRACNEALATQGVVPKRKRAS